MAAPLVLQAFLARPPEERRLGAFHLHSQLGRGGFAPVWLASEIYDGIELRSVAVKLFSLTESGLGGPIRRYREHVVREARALCRVEHKNIVRFYSLVIEDELGLVALVMEYLRGQSLAERFSDRERPDLGETIEIGLAVASALEAAHAAGIVHRDIKPANVMHSADAHKLIDFGISAAEELEARSLDARERRTISEDLPLEVGGTKLSMTMTKGGAGESTLGLAFASGTVGYIDPECVAGATAVPASDLYSLGALLFQCVTGVLPAVAAGGGARLRGEVLDGRARSPRIEALAPKTPQALCELINHLLAPDRLERPASASEVARRLADLQFELGGRRPSTPSPAAHSGQTAAGARSRRALAVGAALVSAAAAAAAVGVVVLRERPEDEARVTTSSPVLATAVVPSASSKESARPTASADAPLKVAEGRTEAEVGRNPEPVPRKRSTRPASLRVPESPKAADASSPPPTEPPPPTELVPKDEF